MSNSRTQGMGSRNRNFYAPLAKGYQEKTNKEKNEHKEVSQGKSPRRRTGRTRRGARTGNPRGTRTWRVVGSQKRKKATESPEKRMTQHVKEAVEVGRRGLQILNGIAKVENHLPEPGFKEEELTQEEKDRAWGALGTLNKIADELFANNQKLKQIHAKIESEKSEGEGEKEEAKKETRESKK